MPTPRETILAALHARLSALPATALPGEMLPEGLSAEGPPILRDGESGEPEVTLSPRGYGRDPLAPIKDAVMADGDVMVPVHFERSWPKAKCCLLRETVFGTPQEPAHDDLCILVPLSASRPVRR